MLPISPDVFHGVQFRSIGWQVFKPDGGVLAGHKVSDQPATMRLGAVSNHQQFLSDVTLQIREKLTSWGLRILPRCN